MDGNYFSFFRLPERSKIIIFSMPYSVIFLGHELSKIVNFSKPYPIGDVSWDLCLEVLVF